MRTNWEQGLLDAELLEFRELFIFRVRESNFKKICGEILLWTYETVNSSKLLQKQYRETILQV